MYVQVWINGQLAIQSHKNLCPSTFRLLLLALYYYIVQRSWNIQDGYMDDQDQLAKQACWQLIVISHLVGPMSSRLDDFTIW